MASRLPKTKSDDDRILTTAVARIAEYGGLSNAKLGAILGLSGATLLPNPLKPASFCCVCSAVWMRCWVAMTRRRNPG